MKTTLLALFICSVCVNTAYASWFGPDNYEDCILENIPKAKTRSAEVLVMKTCRDKFPNREADNRKPDTHLDVLGEYVCEQQLGGNSIFTMYIDEKAKSLRFGTRTINIIRSTEEALFSEKYKASNGVTAFWKIRRLGQNYLAKHDSLLVENVFSKKASPLYFLCNRSM